VAATGRQTNGPGNGAWFNSYWWIPIVGPLIGGVIGILIYDLFISDVLIARAGMGPVPEATYVDDVPPVAPERTAPAQATTTCLPWPEDDDRNTEIWRPAAGDEGQDQNQSRHGCGGWEEFSVEPC